MDDDGVFMGSEAKSFQAFGQGVTATEFLLKHLIPLLPRELGEHRRQRYQFRRATRIEELPEALRAVQFPEKDDYGAVTLAGYRLLFVDQLYNDARTREELDNNYWGYLDALCLYLLFTCADILGSRSYVTFDQWLNRVRDEELDALLAGITTSDDLRVGINELCRRYSSEHGVSTGIRRFFDGVPEASQKKLTEGITIDFVDGKTTDWESLNQERRFKLVVENLYDSFRNAFTHKGEHGTGFLEMAHRDMFSEEGRLYWGNDSPYIEPSFVITAVWPNLKGPQFRLFKSASPYRLLREVISDGARAILNLPAISV